MQEGTDPDRMLNWTPGQEVDNSRIKEERVANTHRVQSAQEAMVGPGDDPDYEQQRLAHEESSKQTKIYLIMGWEERLNVPEPHSEEVLQTLSLTELEMLLEKVKKS